MKKETHKGKSPRAHVSHNAALTLIGRVGLRIYPKPSGWLSRSSTAWPQSAWADHCSFSSAWALCASHDCPFPTVVWARAPGQVLLMSLFISFSASGKLSTLLIQNLPISTPLSVSRPSPTTTAPVDLYSNLQHISFTIRGRIQTTLDGKQSLTFPNEKLPPARTRRVM